MTPTINLGRKKKRDITVNKKALQKWYNSPMWTKLRAEKVRNNPVCEICESKGIVKQVQEVHHIRFIDTSNPDPDMIYDYSNLISLCNSCHSAIHSEARRDAYNKR